jgi:hypothetical protein
VHRQYIGISDMQFGECTVHLAFRQKGLKIFVEEMLHGFDVH